MSAPKAGSEALLEVEDLRVDFTVREGTLQAVRGVSFAVQPGRVLGIVGESGSGKTVSALAVMGLLPRSARVRGSVRYRGQELLGTSDAEMSGVRGVELAMIFQDLMTSLNPVHTVGGQVAEAVLTHEDVSKKEAMERAVALLAMVGIPNPAQRAKGYPHELSGGMRQRAVIAMAMANAPDVIIADEPTTALDVTVQAQVLEALEKAQEETGAAIVLITHDLGVVAGLADDVVVMYAGRLVERAPVDDLYEHPRMPYTLGLLGALPRADTDGQPLTPIEGAPPSLVGLPPGCPFSPRCTLSRPACQAAEPGLRPVRGDAHLAACHFSEELVDGAGAAPS